MKTNFVMLLLLFLACSFPFSSYSDVVSHSIKDIAEQELNVSGLTSEKNFALKAKLETKKNLKPKDFTSFGQISFLNTQLEGTRQFSEIQDFDYSTLGNLPTVQLEASAQWKFFDRFYSRNGGSFAFTSQQFNVSPISNVTKEEARLNVFVLGATSSIGYFFTDRWQLGAFVGIRHLELRQSSSTEAAIFNETALESLSGVESWLTVSSKTQIGLRGFVTNEISADSLATSENWSALVSLAREL